MTRRVIDTTQVGDAEIIRLALEWRRLHRMADSMARELLGGRHGSAGSLRVLGGAVIASDVALDVLGRAVDTRLDVDA